MARRRHTQRAPWQHAPGTFPDGPFTGGEWEHTARAAETAGRLARNVRRMRLDLDLSRAQLAESAGVSEQTVSSVETGRTWADLSTLVGLAAACRVEVSDLFRDRPVRR